MTLTRKYFLKKAKCKIFQFQTFSYPLWNSYFSNPPIKTDKWFNLLPNNKKYIEIKAKSSKNIFDFIVFYWITEILSLNIPFLFKTPFVMKMLWNVLISLTHIFLINDVLVSYFKCQVYVNRVRIYRLS